MLRRIDGANGAAGPHQSTLRRSKKIPKIFKEIAKEGSSMLPDGGMLRKGVLTVPRGKALFPTDQLVQVCEHMFDKLPFVVFKGTADARF